MMGEVLRHSSADVVVAGAGPAGSAAAITLARAGRRVVLVDKARFPRDKCCGDGLTAAALRRLEHLGLDPARVQSWQPATGVTVVSPSGRQVELPLGAPDGGWFAVTAARCDLDAALVDLAVAVGARLLQGRAVTGVDVTGATGGGAGTGGGGVSVHLADGSAVTARYLLACDGMWSPLRRHLGLTPPGYLGEWQAGRCYLRRTGDRARQLWVWFEPDLLPGYAWSFPLPGDRVNFGYGVLRRPGGSGSLRGQTLDWRNRPAIAEVLGPSAEPDGPWRAWPIPARIGRAGLAALGGRVLFAGDAAGACDVMTGEGIAQALESGEAAARAVATAGPERPDLAATRYRRTVRWGMAVDDRLAAALSSVLARPDGADRALALVDRSGWGRRNFARWMFEDYPRAVLATPHRWRRRMFNGPGAYADRGRSRVRPGPQPSPTGAGASWPTRPSGRYFRRP
jgi:geranylgeranyl reductase family protein